MQLAIIWCDQMCCKSLNQGVDAAPFPLCSCGQQLFIIQLEGTGRLHSSCSFMELHVSFIDLHSATTFIVQLCSAGCDDKVGFRSICPGASSDYFKHFSDLVYSMASKPAITSQLRSSKLQHSIATLGHGCFEERKELLKPAFPLEPAHRLDLIPYRNVFHQALHGGESWAFYSLEVIQKSNQCETWCTATANYNTKGRASLLLTVLP